MMIKTNKELTNTPVWARTKHCDERHEMTSAVSREPGGPVLNQSFWIRPPDSRRLHDTAHFTALPKHHFNYQKAVQLGQRVLIIIVNN